MARSTINSISPIEPFIALLVSNWEKRGNSPGVDTYLQIQRVVNTLTGEIKPSQLKNYLAPILAHTPQLQKDFYTFFDQMLEVYAAQQEQQELLFQTNATGQQPSIYGHFPQKIILQWQGFSRKIQFLIVLGLITSIVVPVSLVAYFQQLRHNHLREQAILADPIFSEPRANSSLPNAYKSPATKKKHPDGVSTPASPSNPNSPKLAEDSSSFSEKAPIYFESTKAGGLSFSTQHAYFSPLKGIILLAFTLCLIFIGLWLRYKNRKFGLQPELDPNLPHEWTIRIPFLHHIHMGEAFNLAVVDLRKRHASENLRLNLKQTVKATAEQAGMVDFKYSSLNQTKDYLILLDLGSTRNQRSKLFNLIINTLEEQEVPLSLFYYRDDPRRCWNEQHPEGISLQHLQHKYSTHKLILWGDAAALMESKGKEMAIFDHWRHKIIVSPKAAKLWGQNEALLAKKFRIVPATPKGLAALLENLEAIEPKNYLLWKDIPEKNTDSLAIPNGLAANDLMAILEKEYLTPTPQGQDDNLLKWLAACAMPPVLFWDWVQYAGQIIAQNQNQQLLTLENLYQISKIEWFKEGQIPESARLILLNWLEEKHPFLAIKLRHEWLKVMTLETNLPPINSLTWQGHRIQVILNQLLQKEQLSEHQKLEAELNRLLNADAHQDALLIQYLRQKKSGIDQLLSDRFRKFIQRRQGISWKWRHWTWQLAGTVAGFFLLLFSHFTEPVQVFKFKDYITDTTFNWDNRTFAVFAGDGSVSLCGTEGKWIDGISNGFDNVVESAFSWNGPTLMAINDQNSGLSWGVGNHWAWDWKTQQGSVDAPWKDPRIYNSETTRLVTAAKYLMGFGQMICGYYGGSSALETYAGAELARFTHQDAIRDIDALPDKKLVLTCSNDSTAKLWSFKGKLITTLSGHQDYVYTCCFSPDGKKIATAGRDETAILWNLQGKRLRTFKGHRGDINDIVFTRDSKAIITASSDNTAKMWALDGHLIRTFYGHKDKISTLSVSPDGTKLLTGSNDQTVRLWKLK
ncbi:MAG: hypothetical protein SFV55_27475 [Haliscomenobacter sp.]|uniref:hypothetical protein n=1 Tax=Haliscomenobacter sp. TaxID=2717303 RepID=UPI0029BDEEC4|nr:hypothetical protein [Haliscomenobacter sp.]MDX2072205.1 hypothetical protein [Haliscomenobacter sp.]